MNFHSKKEQPEMGPLGEKRRLWQVELGEGGIIGLPEGVFPKDVILFSETIIDGGPRTPHPKFWKKYECGGAIGWTREANGIKPMHRGRFFCVCEQRASDL